jgi:hypothetical protein
VKRVVSRQGGESRWLWLRHRVSGQTVSQLHQALTGFRIWTKHLLDRVVFTDFILCSVFTTNSLLAKVVSVKFAARLQVCAVLCETSKIAANISVHQDGGRPSTRIPESSIAENWKSCHHKRMPRKSLCSATSYKLLTDIDKFAGCTQAKVGGKLWVDLYCE